MSMKLDIEVTGVKGLDQAAKGFRALIEVVEAVIKSDKRLEKSGKGVVDWLKKQEAAASTSKAELEGVGRAAERTAKAIKGMTAVKLPFTEMAAGAGKLKHEIGAMNKELLKTQEISRMKLEGGKGYKNYMAAVRNAKAALIVEQRLNAEIEKQARLTAELATLKTSRNATLKEGTKNLKIAQEQTAAIQNLVNAEKLLVEARAGGNAKAIQDAKDLVAMNRAGTMSVKELAAAYEKLAGTKKAASGTSKVGDRATIEKETAALKAQGHVLGEVKTRLQALSKTKMPTEDVKRLEKAVKGLNLRLERTGTSQARGINKTRTELKMLEAQFLTTGKATMDWSKATQYAVGGVARSMGAMTYSYAMLAPLMVGMAFGAAVKKIYELGAAFEYTTTYVNALATLLDKIGVVDIQENLLEMEGLRKGPGEMAMGMKEFAKAGVEAAQSIGQIAEMSKFASIAEMEMGEAVKLVIGQSKAYGMSFTESANMISAAALSSATSIQELGTALSYTTELATVSGVKFNEVATAMAIMANAGIRGCYDDETEVMTKGGWKKWDAVTYDDEFATYNSSTGILEYQEPERLIRYHYTGQMYKVCNKGIDLCVTPEHRMYVKRRDQEEYEILTANEISGKQVRYKTGGLDWVGEDPSVVTLPGFEQHRGSWIKDVPDLDIDAELWATFLGWYLAEGHCSQYKGNYRVVITQKKTRHLKRMEEVFDALPWNYTKHEGNGQYTFVSQQLFQHLKPLGNVYEKQIPQYAKNWGTDLLSVLYQSLLDGDGDAEKKYYTSSVRLRDDVQEVALKLGYSTLYRQTLTEGDTCTFTGGRQIIARADGWKVSVTDKRTEPWFDPNTYKGKHGERMVDESAYEHYEGWVDYDGEVFCAEVPNGLLIVRRKGRAIVSGNSKAGTAIRTSVIKMQAPSTKLKKTLDELGISWSAFTEEGQIKNLRTMFTELKKVTDALPPAKKVAVLKELFGLRAIKGGANVLRSMGDEWDNLNEKIKESIEGVSFIDETYDKLSDTVTVKVEELGAEFQKSLIKAFDSDAVKGILEDLQTAIASDGFVDHLKGVITSINFIGRELSALTKIVSMIPVDMVTGGLVGYALFGSSPHGRVIALLAAASKEIAKFKKEVVDVSSVEDIDERIAGINNTLKNSLSLGLGAARQELEAEIMRLEDLKKNLDGRSLVAITLQGYEDAFRWMEEKFFSNERKEIDWSSYGPPKHLGDQWADILDMGDDGRILSWIEKLQDLGLEMEEIKNPEMVKYKLDMEATIDIDTPEIRSYVRDKILEIRAIAKEEADAYEREGLKAQALQRTEAVPAVVKAVYAEMDRLDKDLKYQGLEGWEKKLADVDKQVEAFIKTASKGEDGITIDINLEAVDKYRQKLKDALVDKGIKVVQKAIDDLTFKNMITELEKSVSYMDILAAKTAKFDRDFFKEAKDANQTEIVGGREVLTALAKEQYELAKEEADLKGKSQKQQIANAKKLKVINDASFDGIMKDLEKITKLAGLSAWGKQLAGVETDLEKYVQKAKDTGQKLDDEQKARVKEGLMKALNVKPAMDLKKAIEDVTFENMVAELEKSVSLADILAAKTARFEREFSQRMRDDGRTETVGGKKVLNADALKLMELERKRGNFLEASQKQQRANEKAIKDIRDRSFDGMMEDLKEIGRVAGLSVWEQQLDAIKKKYDDIAEKAKAAGDEMSKAEVDRLKSEAESQLVAENTREINRQIEGIKFDNMISGFRKSGTIAEDLKATLAEIERDQMKIFRDSGAVTGEGVGFVISPEALELLIALKDQAINESLSLTNQLLDEASSTIQEIDYGIWFEGLGAYEKEYESLQRSIKNNPIVVALGAEAGIDATQIGNLDEFLKIAEAHEQMTGLNETTRAFLEILRQVKERMEGAFDKQNIREVEEAIKGMEADNLIQSLKESKSDVDKLKGAYLELRKKAEDFLIIKKEAWRTDDGVLHMTKLGKEYFKVMMDGANLFGNRLKALKEEMKGVVEGMGDEEFKLELEIYGDEGKKAAILSRIEDIRREAEIAGAAGSEGWREQVRLLEKAKGLILSMDSNRKAVTRDEVIDAKKSYEYFLRITRGGLGAFGDAAVKLKSLRDEYNRLYKAHKDNEPDPKGAVDDAKEKLSAVEEINNEIKGLMKDNIDEFQK
ncbi:MAG: hypothetical protein DRQ39_05705, partial [Gammaproteobacteria bacterium]